MIFKGISLGQKVASNSLLDLLIYQMIKFCFRSAPGLFDQKRAVIADLLAFKLVLNLDLDRNIEVGPRFFQAKAGLEFFDHPNHNAIPYLLFGKCQHIGYPETWLGV